LIESRQSHSKESRVQFFGPPCTYFQSFQNVGLYKNADSYWPSIYYSFRDLSLKEII